MKTTFKQLFLEESKSNLYKPDENFKINLEKRIGNKIEFLKNKNQEEVIEIKPKKIRKSFLFKNNYLRFGILGLSILIIIFGSSSIYNPFEKRDNPSQIISVAKAREEVSKKYSLMLSNIKSKKNFDNETIFYSKYSQVEIDVDNISTKSNIEKWVTFDEVSRYKIIKTLSDNTFEYYRNGNQQFLYDYSKKETIIQNAPDQQDLLDGDPEYSINEYYELDRFINVPGIIYEISSIDNEILILRNTTDYLAPDRRIYFSLKTFDLIRFELYKKDGPQSSLALQRNYEKIEEIDLNKNEVDKILSIY